MTEPKMPRVADLREVRTSLANWLNGLQRIAEDETGKTYPRETAGMISANTLQGCLVDVSRLTIKIQQLLIEHPDLQERFGPIAA